MGQTGFEGRTLPGQQKIFRLQPLGLLSNAEGLLLKPNATETTGDGADEQG
jgi:hypothetical protein